MEDLKKESQKRPRQRKNSTNLINKFKTDLISNNKNVCINEESYSYKTVSKLKLTPVMKHYVTLKEENKDRLLLYRLGDFFECFFEFFLNFFFIFMELFLTLLEHLWNFFGTSLELL